MTTEKKHLVYAVIVAAGKGKRMASEENKVFLPLCGKPVIAHTVSVFEQSSAIDSIIVVAAWGEIQKMRTIFKRERFTKVRDVVKGGKTRQASVLAGLEAIVPDFGEAGDHAYNTRIALVHDGARCLVSEDIILSCLQTIRKSGSAAGAAIPITDTVRQLDHKSRVQQILDRDVLRSMQTPQGADFYVLLNAHREAAKLNMELTDDLAVMEKLGYPVRLSPGSQRNIKLTNPEDFLIAQGLLKVDAPLQ